MSQQLTASPILLTIFKISVKHKKYYAYPSQLKILALLEKWQHIKRCRRTLNYWLRGIEDKDLIRRKRRIGYDRVHGLIFHSSLYMITLNGYFTLRNAGVDVGKRISAIVNKLRDTQGRQDKNKERSRRLKDMVEALNIKTVRDMQAPG